MDQHSELIEGVEAGPASGVSGVSGVDRGATVVRGPWAAIDRHDGAGECSALCLETDHGLAIAALAAAAHRSDDAVRLLILAAAWIAKPSAPPSVAGDVATAFARAMTLALERHG